MEVNKIYNADCMDIMKNMESNLVDITVTDIPYDECNRSSNGLRNLDKEVADVMTFNLLEFLEEVYRVTNGTIIIFCGTEQFSFIHKFFSEKQAKKLGTVRQLIWEKSNPSPMNGQYIYLSGIENAVWFKKKGSTFNAKCKNTVFRYPCGRSKLHPTEKNHALIREIILDNSKECDVVFDPCCGSGSHCYVAKECNRNFIGIELNVQYFNIAQQRLAALA